ncbi:hypothetical protein SADUNF_Sadunf01G0025500 [Salix dunnii]|uniref:Peptidyl-prolyl cis-trans isomerase n=1 Tax=Salix dunnii TaxID=1413687 RepID=A0A835N9D1_9ROSI|nr:hypothetical protein SADUNF_Sadunf01G0025500 [Salix dunnii]
MASGGGSVEWHLRPPNPKNPIVFFDITIGTIAAGRIKMELFADIAPKTAENFRQFCTGEHRKAGLPGDGSGCVSIYGHKFEDENFVAKHTGPGLLSMANSGPNTNGCQWQFKQHCTLNGNDPFTIPSARQTKHALGLSSIALNGSSGEFFITCAKCDWLDNKHVVFGRVLGDGLLVVRKVENVATGPNNRPKLPCAIAECGEM